MAWEGFKARMIIVRTLNPSMPENLEQLYQERLRIELDYIIAMRFAEYFLVVADYVNWAKDNGIPVGPGRGAIGGSLVAYALRITEIDPIAHNLLFERYINPERVVLPDIYLDFCMERRQEVLDYIIKKYGRNRICRSPIFETFSFDDAMRQTGRIMNMNESYVKKIRKMYHTHLGNRYPGDESNLPKLRKHNLENIIWNGGDA
jgi:DNA polymerase-3 subunit alpha